MGCGESRVKRISLTSEQDWEGGTENWENSSDVGSKQLKVVQELSVSSLEQPTIEEEEKVDNVKNVWEGLKSEAPPNRLLDSIPTSDLGESLDCRPRRVVEVDHHFFNKHQYTSINTNKHLSTSININKHLRVSLDCRPRRVVELILNKHQ